MNLSKKIKEISINHQNYVLCFDMKSILKYKELSNKTFTSGIDGLFNGDDEETMYFIASTLRRKETPGVPLGTEVLNGNVIEYIVNFKLIVQEVIIDSLPQDDNSKKK